MGLANGTLRILGNLYLLNGLIGSVGPTNTSSTIGFLSVVTADSGRAVATGAQRLDVATKRCTCMLRKTANRS